MKKQECKVSFEEDPELEEFYEEEVEELEDFLELMVERKLGKR